MKQEDDRAVIIRFDEIWQSSRAGVELCGRGDQGVLARPLTAFFASRQCPGAAIRLAMDWALQQAREKAPVIGGFHSPLERSVLELLLEARSPVVMVLARSVEAAHLQREWKGAIERGHLVVVSAARDLSQITEKRAVVRNDLVADLATEIVVAHAAHQGSLETQMDIWRRRGTPMQCLGKVVR